MNAPLGMGPFATQLLADAGLLTESTLVHVEQLGTAPIVPDELLDELGRAFVSFGGQRLLGITFERYVRQQLLQRTDPRAHLRVALRNAIDRRLA